MAAGLVRGSKYWPPAAQVQVADAVAVFVMRLHYYDTITGRTGRPPPRPRSPCRCCCGSYGHDCIVDAITILVVMMMTTAVTSAIPIVIFITTLLLRPLFYFCPRRGACIVVKRSACIVAIVLASLFVIQ